MHAGSKAPLQENNTQQAEKGPGNKIANSNSLAAGVSKPKRKYTRRRKVGTRKTLPPKVPARRAKKSITKEAEIDEDQPLEPSESDTESGELDPDDMDFEIAQALSNQFKMEGPVAGRTTRARKQLQQSRQRSAIA